MKNTIIKFLQSIISNKSVFLKLKDILFCNPSEHLFRIIDYAYKNYKGKLNLPIIDIGAADGGTAAYFSKNFKSATIIAFEPIEKMFKIAKELNEPNKNVNIKNIGLFNSIGEQEINITANYLSSSINELNTTEINAQSSDQQTKFQIIEKQKIRTSTLDEETRNLAEILLIKIDTQGSELVILNSGKEALAKTHLLLIEMNNHDMYKDGCQYYEVDEFMRQQNFKLVDVIVTYRPDGVMQEYDAIYENKRKW